MSHSFFTAHNGYEDREYSVETTNGAERVSLVMRPVDSISGLGASMAPDVARELGADLIARADKIDPPDPALDAVREMPDPRDDALDLIAETVRRYADPNQDDRDPLDVIADILRPTGREV